MTNHNIKVRGVRREPMDPDEVALVFWLLAKGRVRERREQERKEGERRRRQEAADER